MFQKTSDSGFASQPCESVPELIRQASDRTVMAMGQIERLVSRPAVLVDRNGRGAQYLKLQYRYHIPGQHSFYLGVLTPAEHHLLAQLITARWPREELHSRIRKLAASRNEYRHVATELAGRLGFRFRGRNLYRRKR